MNRQQSRKPKKLPNRGKHPGGCFVLLCMISLLGVLCSHMEGRCVEGVVLSLYEWLINNQSRGMKTMRHIWSKYSASLLIRPNAIFFFPAQYIGGSTFDASLFEIGSAPGILMSLRWMALRLASFIAIVHRSTRYYIEHTFLFIIVL